MTKRIFMQGMGISGVHVVQVDDGARVGSLVEHAKQLGQQSGAATSVFLEDGETPLPTNETLERAGVMDNAAVHVGRCVRVHVTVRYAGKPNVTRDFSPAQKVEQVFKWAVSKNGFDIPQEDALDFALQACGKQGAANNDDHVGSFVGGEDCAVCFDLIPTDRIQG